MVARREGVRCRGLLSPWQPSSWVAVAIAGAIAAGAGNTLLARWTEPVTHELWVNRLSAPFASPGAFAVAAATVIGPYLRPAMRGADDLRDPIVATQKLHAAGREAARLYSPEELSPPAWSIPLQSARIEPPDRPHYHGSFVYPPSTCLLLWPLGGLSEARATQTLDIVFRLCWLFTVGLCTAIVVAPRTLWATAPTTHAAAAEMCAVAAMFLAFIPGVRMLYLVQIQSLLTLALALAIVAWARGYDVTAAIGFALAAAIKPNWGALLAFGLLRRNWRFSVAMASTLAALALGSWWLAGSSNWVAYLTQILPRMGTWGAYQPNQSVSGMLYRWIGAGAPWLYAPIEPHAAINRASTLMAGLLLLVGSWPRVVTSAAGRVFDLVMALLCVPLATPVAWEHHFAWTIVPFAALFAFYRHVHPAPAAGKWVAFCVAYVLAANYLYTMPVRSTGWLGLYHSHLLIAMFMLLLMTYAGLRDAEAAGCGAKQEALTPRLARSRQ